MNETMPKIIRNRDIPLLARVNCIMQEICSLEKRCEWQRERMYSITCAINGMPASKGLPKSFDAALEAIDEITQEHREKIASYVHELKAAERIISGISSQTMRTFVRMLYVDHSHPDKVRAALKMTEWAFRRARDCVEQAPDMASVVWKEKYLIENQKN